MTNELSISDQKLLTEFLGECWHEVEFELSNSDWYFKCYKCNSSKMVGTSGTCNESEYRLDFSDWRVVGRLIEKLDFLMLGTNKILWGVSLDGEGNTAKFYGNTPQLAICRAIVNFLKEKE